jgi:flagellar biosynthetic protein FliR
MDLIEALNRLLGQLGIGIDLTRFLVVFGLGMSRLLGAILLNPFLGGAVVPARLKVGLAAIITAVIFPSISTGAENLQMQSISVFALMLKEVMIGVTIGLVSQFLFYAVQMAGTIIDTQRGMNQATFFAPQLPGNVSLVGQFKFQAALALFLTVNGHLLFLRAVSDSFQSVAVWNFPAMSSGVQALSDQVIRLSATTLIVAIQLSAPVLIVLFLIDVAFGAISKIAPHIDAHGESQPLKALVGLIIVFLTIGFVMSQLNEHFAVLIQDVYSIIRLFV